MDEKTFNVGFSTLDVGQNLASSTVLLLLPIGLVLFYLLLEGREDCDVFFLLLHYSSLIMLNSFSGTSSSFIVSTLFWWSPLLILAYRSYSGSGIVWLDEKK